jgi:hypothetical protein
MAISTAKKDNDEESNGILEFKEFHFKSTNKTAISDGSI